MRGPVCNVAFLITLLFFVSSCHAAMSVSALEDDLVNALGYKDAETVSLLTGQHAEIDTLKAVLSCGAADLTSTPRCIHYSYKSSALLEAFVIDREAYQSRGRYGLISKGVIIPGSYCVDKSCKHTADLHDVQDWCLMLMNIDPNRSTASVDFEYQVCVEGDNKKDLILILSAVCVGLAAVALATCIGCCWMMRRRRGTNTKETTKKEEQVDSINAPFLPPPPMPHNPDVFYSMPMAPPPPMVSHTPFRPEPLFQVQPPLPISHVPLPPGSTQPSTSSAQEIHVQFPPTEKKTTRKAKSKIRFPI